MTLTVMALFAWIVIIVFVLIPKRFTLADFIFLYFVCVVLTITLFSHLDVNVHWVPTTRDVEKSFALHICRFIEIPLLVIMSANILHSNFRSWRRWALTAVIIAVLILGDYLMRWTDMIEFVRWNVVYSVLMYGIFIVSIAWIERWFVKLDKGDTIVHGSN